MTSHFATQRIVVVSNRLPFTVQRESGNLTFTPSAGGVATGLKALLDTIPDLLKIPADYIWVGWPGATIEAEQKNEVGSRARAEFHSHPVFLSEEAFENFYQGFCNKTIWPLFHYFPANARYHEQYWQEYRNVNEAFAEAVLAIVQPDDILWIHDYHLMLLPKLLRQKLPNIRMGFFLHIPFPQFEIFRLLPVRWRQDILEGLLGADLVGFHTHDYAKYFLGCVQRVLGIKHRIGQIALEGRMVKVTAFPMGVDYGKFHSTALSPAVQTEKKQLREKLGETKIILSVDRQDYSKGIIHRLQGFETLLEKYPHWHGKVALLMIVVPSRIGIDDYEGTKNQIEELVGKINGKFSAIHWAPIMYQYRAFPFDNLVALYAVSDVALVTPLRDGMNLVAKEWVASRTDRTGVLVLSEMAGAAKELAEAILINPNHREEIAAALDTALEMPREDQIRRNRLMQSRLRRYDVGRWAADFIGDLLLLDPGRKGSLPKLLGPFGVRKLLDDYRRSLNRLLLFDYDGTLVPFASHPLLARADRRLLKILHLLGANPRNELVLLSGRDKATLEDWFGSLPIGLVAEHGAWIKERQKRWEIAKPISADWKANLLPVLQSYAGRVPGTWVEEKEFSLVWHYRRAVEEQGAFAARELTDDLCALAANIDVQILQANMAVEIRNTGIHKGLASQRWLQSAPFDFILAIGDDLTDEDTFTVLPDHAYSIRVGNGPTHAGHYMHGPKEVINLLDGLVKGEHIGAVPYVTASA
jgi:trehalose 6-phosphate synthase/phosphatase